MSNKTEIWRARLHRWRQQSESIRAFCLSEGVSENSFYSWRRKLEGSAASNRLVSVSLPSVSHQAGLKIQLRSGQIVMIDRHTDLDLLKSVVSTLEADDVC